MEFDDGPPAVRFCYHDHDAQMSFTGTSNTEQEPQPVILRSAATKPALSEAEGNLASGDHKRQIPLRLRRIRMTDRGLRVPYSMFLGGWEGDWLCP